MMMMIRVCTVVPEVQCKLFILGLSAKDQKIKTESTWKVGQANGNQAI